MKLPAGGHRACPRAPTRGALRSPRGETCQSSKLGAALAARAGYLRGVREQGAMVVRMLPPIIQDNEGASKPFSYSPRERLAFLYAHNVRHA